MQQETTTSTNAQQRTLRILILSLLDVLSNLGRNHGPEGSSKLDEYMFELTAMSSRVDADILDLQLVEGTAQNIDFGTPSASLSVSAPSRCAEEAIRG